MPGSLSKPVNPDVPSIEDINTMSSYQAMLVMQSLVLTLAEHPSHRLLMQAALARMNALSAESIDPGAPSRPAEAPVPRPASEAGDGGPEPMDVADDVSVVDGLSDVGSVPLGQSGGGPRREGENSPHFDLYAADSDPRLDPRVSNTIGERIMTDAQFVAAWPEKNQVTEVDRATYLGMMKMDTSLSKSRDTRLSKLIKHIVCHHMMDRKTPDRLRKNNDGSVVRLVTPQLVVRPPSDPTKSVLNLIFGDPQSGKTEEALWVCFVMYHVCGVLPTYLVRNSGGLSDSEQVAEDFTNFNKRLKKWVRALVVRHEHDLGGNPWAWVTEDIIDQLLLSPRMLKDGVEVEICHTTAVHPKWDAPEEYCVRLSKPQVLIMLTRGDAMDKFAQKSLSTNQKEFVLKDGTIIGVQTIRKMIKQFTAFELMGGRHHVGVSMNRGGKKKVSLGRVILHSAYSRKAYNMEMPYDNGVNAYRLRIGRLCDEVDADKSDKSGNATMAANYDSRTVQKKTADLLDPEAALLRRDKEELLEKQEVNQKKIDRRQRVKDNIKEQQHVDRVLEFPPAGGRGSGRAPTVSYAESEDDDDDVDSVDDENDKDWLEHDDWLEDDDDGEEGPRSGFAGGGLFEGEPQYEDEDDDDDDPALHPDDDDVNPIDRDLLVEKSNIEKEMKRFLAKEAKAMQKALGRCDHITGQQSAAFLNVGITATIFGCMHPNAGSGTIVKVTVMVRPDAYNALCQRGEDDVLRMLDDPSVLAQPGSIEVLEVDERMLGAIDVRSGKGRTTFIDNWILEKKFCTLDEEGNAIKDVDGKGLVYPREPLAPLTGCRKDGACRGGKVGYCSWHIPKALYETPDVEPKPGEDPRNARVLALMDDYERAKKVAGSRNQNMWERNGPMFTRTTTELQRQRPLLKETARLAKALVITNETRKVKTKEMLMADMFSRLGWEEEDSPMHETSCYNYSCEGVELVINPAAITHEYIIERLQNPSNYEDELREYLSKDVRMTSADLSPENLREKIIKNVQKLYEMTDRANANGARMRAPGVNGKKNMDLSVYFKEDVAVSKDPDTKQVIGTTNVVRMAFGKCKVPAYIMDLWTLIDACRHADTPDCLPAPLIGFTKTIGGRAQRYQDHMHRSRPQVMTHTTDVFPTKKLGLAASDMIQEGLRCAGNDHVNMQGWVRQKYVTTKDFTPLIKNALVSQREWTNLVNNPPVDMPNADTAEPCDIIVYVLEKYWMECMRVVQTALDAGLPHPGPADMPDTPYPSLVTWAWAHVNRAGASARYSELPYLRHSTRDESEAEMRCCLRKTLYEKLEQEFDDEVDGEYHEPLLGSGPLGEVTDDDRDQARKGALDRVMGRVPRPQFSEHHAPGGTLDQREAAEKGQDALEILRLVRDEENIRRRYELITGSAEVDRPSAGEKKRISDEALRAKTQTMREMKIAQWPCAKWDDSYLDPSDWPRDQLPPYSAREVRAYKANRDGEPVSRSGGKKAKPAVNVVFRDTESKMFRTRNHVAAHYPDYKEHLEGQFDDKYHEFLRTRFPERSDDDIERDVTQAKTRVTIGVASRMSSLASEAAKELKESKGVGNEPTEQEIIDAVKQALPSVYTGVIGRDDSFNKLLTDAAQAWGKAGAGTHLDVPSAIKRFREYVTMPDISDEELARFAATCDAVGPTLRARPPSGPYREGEDEPPPRAKRAREPEMPSSAEMQEQHLRDSARCARERALELTGGVADDALD